MKREKLENLKDLRLKCKLSHVVYKGEEMEEVGLHGDSKWLQCLSFLFLPILLLSFLIGGKKRASVNETQWENLKAILVALSCAVRTGLQCYLCRAVGTAFRFVLKIHFVMSVRNKPTN